MVEWVLKEGGEGLEEGLGGGAGGEADGEDTEDIVIKAGDTETTAAEVADEGKGKGRATESSTQVDEKMAKLNV